MQYWVRLIVYNSVEILGMRTSVADIVTPPGGSGCHPQISGYHLRCTAQTCRIWCTAQARSITKSDLVKDIRTASRYCYCGVYRKYSSSPVDIRALETSSSRSAKNPTKRASIPGNSLFLLRQAMGPSPGFGDMENPVDPPIMAEVGYCCHHYLVVPIILLEDCVLDKQ